LGDASVTELSGQKPRSRPAVAREAKVSERKLRQAIEVSRDAPQLAKEVVAGKIPLAAAVREIKRAAIKEKLESTVARQAKELTGRFDVIVADPPWLGVKVRES